MIAPATLADLEDLCSLVDTAYRWQGQPSVWTVVQLGDSADDAPSGDGDASIGRPLDADVLFVDLKKTLVRATVA